MSKVRDIHYIELILMGAYPFAPLTFAFAVFASSCSSDFLRNLFTLIPIACLVGYLIACFRLALFSRPVTYIIVHTVYATIAFGVAYILTIMMAVPYCVA